VRRRKAVKKMEQLRKKGMNIQPIEIEGRKITKTFWGHAWCDHMESQGDFDNRLPRGRTYVRNGSVCHLAIEKGRITAMVSGSSLYKIEVKIDVLPKAKWKRLKSRCQGHIASLLELLQGRFSDNVMKLVTDPKDGLFPRPQEIHLACSCPDWATMCKHVAAVLYGVGARLDEQPELLFLLRGVNHEELVDDRVDEALNRATKRGGKRHTVAEDKLGDVFGIELEPNPSSQGNSTTGKRKRTSAKKVKKPKTAAVKNKKPKTTKKATSKSPKKKVANTSTTKTVALIKKKAKKKTATTRTPKKKAAAKKTEKKTVTKTKSVKKQTRAGRTVKTKKGPERFARSLWVR